MVSPKTFEMDSKRTWTDEETLAFVGFMEEMVIEGQRADAGQFKPGVFPKLAIKMNEKFPGSGFTAKHCKNKQKRLKEKYQSASDMLACSGFGWNHEKQTVEVDSKQVLELWIKHHPLRFYTPGKPFPLFTRLETIFGKDRATGSYAMSGNDAAEQLDTENEEIPLHFNDVVNDFDMFESDPLLQTNSPLQPNASMASSSEGCQRKITATKKKDKEFEIFQELAQTVRFAVEQQGKHVEVLAKAMAGINEEVKLGETLQNLGFSDDEVVLVGLKFSQNPQLQITFWSLTENQRRAFARAIIHS